MSCDDVKRCASCGDRLIHQTQRGRNESSSVFGQFVHDRLPNDFYRVDDDQATHYKKATQIWRHIEHKFTGQGRSGGQVVTMQKHALAIRELVALGRVAPSSGSFVVVTDAPFEVGIVKRIDPVNGAEMAPLALEGEQWTRFLTGLHIEEGAP